MKTESAFLQFISTSDLESDFVYDISTSDNDKMDRDETLLKYIDDQDDKALAPSYPTYTTPIHNPYSYINNKNVHQEQRFSNMFTQDAYYELPRSLQF